MASSGRKKGEKKEPLKYEKAKQQFFYSMQRPGLTLT